MSKATTQRNAPITMDGKATLFHVIQHASPEHPTSGNAQVEMRTSPNDTRVTPESANPAMAQWRRPTKRPTRGNGVPSAP